MAHSNANTVLLPSVPGPVRQVCSCAVTVAVTAAVAIIPATLAAQTTSDDRADQLVEATIAELHAAMESGLLTAEGLVGRYQLRMAAYDQTGPRLSSMITENPSVIAEARARDRAARQGGTRGPLFGIPVLLKDNVDALPMATTAGSVALVGSIPPDDAFITARLRRAGAVVIGKATLTEFANFMTTNGMPNGYSSLGGHGVNPYDPRRNADGSAMAHPGGSSSGSAIATAANLTSVAIGTETSGSILSPSSRNGVVGIKPTVGLVSRDGILPITSDQDTAGPIARTVAEAATVLGVIAGHDPNDPATAACLTPGNCFDDYTQFLERTALRGARIAVPPPPFPLNAEQRRIVQAAIGTLRAAGAFVADPYQITDPMLGPICVSHPPPVGQSTVLIFGMKRELDAYLLGLGPNAPRQSLAQVIAFNNSNPGVALRYGQTILVACDQYDPTSNSADEQRYLADRLRDVTNSRASLDAAYAGPDGQPGTADDFDAILYPSNFGADAPARAGYPSVCVPAGFMTRPSGPPLPFGVTFTGPAFSEPRLIALAYAFEQATGHRSPPASAPPLPTDTIPLTLASVRTLGNGCSGSAGVPAIHTVGPPILGNGAFAIGMTSLRPNATAFVAISPRSGFFFLGTCLVRVAIPVQLVIPGTSDAGGNAELDLPIPWNASFSGAMIFVQGGALDPLGAANRVAALTGALEITIGG